VRVAACCSRGMCLDELSDPAFGSDGRPRPGASGGTQEAVPRTLYLSILRLVSSYFEQTSAKSNSVRREGQQGVVEKSFARAFARAQCTPAIRARRRN
jgi:hypothetical protein